MGNENYREAFENDRQEISLNSESSLSRRAKRNAAKQKPKQNKSLLLPVLFFIFILIPVMVLIYVAFLYEPTEPIMEASANNEVSVETNTTSSEDPQLAVTDDDD
ncbi:MAG TPA: LysM peptidoglycan-binding domain-containing protein, partial [Planococcus sp. (in: firmicutes)]|nr:LysM peptidoglycan-binding domain-containing protein [Planococcus sp. (in: firmicutes)]